MNPSPSPPLTEAQAAPTKLPGFMVYLCGLGTVGLSLFLVSFLNGTDFNVMGWYWLFVIPIGAILVGAVAGCGYAFGSWLTNVKIMKGFLWIIFATAVLNWFASSYVTYTHLLAQLNESEREGLTFLTYLQFVAESFAFSSRSGEPGAPLGKLGYLFMLLEIGGFSAGTLVPVILLGQKPYCHRCAKYLKKTGSQPLGSSLAHDDLKKNNKEERTEKITAAVQEVVGAAQQVIADVESTGYEETAQRIREVPEPAAKKPLASVHFNTWKCPNCDGHVVKAMLTNATLGGQPHSEELVALDKTGASPETPRAFTADTNIS